MPGSSRRSRESATSRSSTAWLWRPTRPPCLPAATVLPGLVRRRWRALAKQVKALGDPPTDEELHAVRIEAKRVRYAAEAAVPLLGRQARVFAHAAAALQGVLGDLNDAVVAERWLRGWAGESRSTLEVFAAGELAGLGARCSAGDASALAEGVEGALVAEAPLVDVTEEIVRVAGCGFNAALAWNAEVDRRSGRTTVGRPEQERLGHCPGRSHLAQSAHMEVHPSRGRVDRPRMRWG